jgi:phosphate transport system substrate-binding protein
MRALPTHFSLPLRTVATAALCLASGLTALCAEVVVDEKIAAYQTAPGIAGNLNSIGSDTLNNVMTYWAEAFQGLYPNVVIQIEGKGSTTAPPALIEGTAQLGPMSRQMKPTELDAFEKKFGYKPTEIKVAIDALAVFVHKDNPIKGLTLTQIDSIFSSTLKRGGKNAATWGDLGLADWAGKPVSLFGRNSASGTYGYFKEHALSKGDYKSTVKEQPGSSAVVQGVASDIAAIGYSGIGYVTSSVHALPLADKGGDFVEPTYENCLNGKYPLSRYLYVYVNKKPGQPLDPLVNAFVTFILAKQGQEIVVKDGYFPLPSAVIETTSAAIK